MPTASLRPEDLAALKRWLDDCHVPVIREPGGSVSVGSGELAARRLLALERQALREPPPCAFRPYPDPLAELYLRTTIVRGPLVAASIRDIEPGRLQWMREVRLEPWPLRQKAGTTIVPESQWK